MNHLIFDTELMGSSNPIFLVCAEVFETGQRFTFREHVDGDMRRLYELMISGEYTWVGMNSAKFDMPMLAAITDGLTTHDLKEMATDIIERNMQPWMVAKRYDFEELNLDHIDLFEVAPGVMVSLKTYMGRMGAHTLIDLPFDHTKDLTDEEIALVEEYCWNDVAGTRELFTRIRKAIDLRVELGAHYGLDLRSKSDAQCAEAIFKHVLVLPKQGYVPREVEYRAPDFIQTKSEIINELINKLEWEVFDINRANGSPVEPEWMKEPIQLGHGTYKLGLGGLHSTHDKQLHVKATEKMLISDFDVASYYPNIIMKAGIVPEFPGDKGERFLEMYREIYEQRMVAKAAGNKGKANTFKIILNGTFGKLGSMYSTFYAPELLLAVTLTGQLNLMCLIFDLEKIKGVRVLSANTDGIMVHYPASTRERVLKVITRNSKQTGFDYEETPYRTIAMKDVNNYLAITTDDEVKGKGLYASNRPEENPLYLMKNPTMEACTRMVREYLLTGAHPEHTLEQLTDMRDFVAVRNVKGGGVQHTHTKLVDDWVEVEDRVWVCQLTGKKAKRKSRPHPITVGVGGKPFGRVARWYMTTDTLEPITYVGSGNKVPKTEGAKLCMTLPDALPSDLDRAWYVQSAYEILADMGVKL